MNKRFIIIGFLLSASLLYPTSHALRQMVRNWPEGYDATGAHWHVYDLCQAETHVLDETSIGSYTVHSASLNAVRWTCDVGNFPGADWQEGDTIVAFGSWDSAYVTDSAGYGAKVKHTGFYWLFSDTLDKDVDPQDLSPADTLRVMSKPLAAQVGDSIEIAITNPLVTVSGISTYGVLGYWFWADTTGSGTPDGYDKELGFVPVQGGAGETTIFRHPVEGNYEDAQTVYWAYKLVAVPDTTANDSRQGCPGYATYYLSQNSNPIVIIGIEESQILNPQSQIPQLAVYPNPANGVVRITCSVTRNIRDGALSIYDASGRVVKNLSLPNDYPSMSTVVFWDGTDDAGHKLPAGIYFVELVTGDYTEMDKVILLR
jgi:hypothetical protein